VSRARPRLLLYLCHEGDLHRYAVAPALAAAAGRAGWAFDLYVDAPRAGRHFGGGDPERAPRGHASGTPFAGGRHDAKLLWLAHRVDLVALGDPQSPLWPLLDAVGAAALARTADHASLYEAAFGALELDVPSRLLVLDGRPQGPAGVVTAPYLYPELAAGEPALAVDAAAEAGLVGRLEALGAARPEGLAVEPARRAAFPRPLSERLAADASSYDSLTAELAERRRDWGRGLLLGDPELVAAQLPKAFRLRLLPLYGRPQVAVLRRAEAMVREAREPVYGRQYDDRDFFELARLGHGLQVVDPSPPFDAAAAAAHVANSAAVAAAEAVAPEPPDEVLERWADEGRVLVTLLFWMGMVREVDCLAPLLDVVADTGLHAGLVVTADSVEHAGGSPLSQLGVPPERGGALGLLEPLLGSTGRGVAAEALLPPGTLGQGLAEAREAAARLLPAGLRLRGWWPLLDAPLVPARARPIGLRGRRPVVRFTPRARELGDGACTPEAANAAGTVPRDVRGLAAAAVLRLRLDGLLEERRPYELQRPGVADERIAEDVRGAGFEYMWTKARFGTWEASVCEDGFVSLPFTAGNWDGWSPFYTVARAPQLARAERRLRRRGGPGWLASTVDSPLLLLPGELLEHGGALHRLASFAAGGGGSGELVNVTPHVVARYARLLARRSGRPMSGG
jgi:hypothetical protein